jgi:chorismate mutase
MDSALEKSIQAIANALNERFHHCRTIGRLKAVHGLPTLRKTVEDAVKQRARERFDGVGEEIDAVFDHILSHSRGLQDHVREAFEEAGAKAGGQLSDNVEAQIDEQRRTVQLADAALLDALNDYRARRSAGGDGADIAEEIANALLNTLETPDDPRFDEALRLISERIAALS